MLGDPAHPVWFVTHKLGLKVFNVCDKFGLYMYVVSPISNIELSSSVACPCWLPCRWYVTREHDRWPSSKLSGYRCLPTVHRHQSPSARWYVAHGRSRGFLEWKADFGMAVQTFHVSEWECSTLKLYLPLTGQNWSPKLGVNFCENEERVNIAWCSAIFREHKMYLWCV